MATMGKKLAQKLYNLVSDIPEYDDNKDSSDEAKRLDQGLSDVMAIIEDWFAEHHIGDYHDKKLQSQKGGE